MRLNGARATSLPGGLHCLVELATDEGLTGQAPCAAAVAAQAVELAEDLLMGCDPRAVSTLWDALGAAGGKGGRPVFEQARASLDMACWDLKARRNSEPLWKTLGGGTPNAVAYGSWPAPHPLLDDAADALGQLASAGGFHRGLIRLGDYPGDDARLLGQLRDVLGEHGRPVDLMADLGQAWPGDACRRIAALETEFDLVCVKGVARAGDYRGCKRVGDAVAAAVCAGGDLGSEESFLPLLHAHAANVIEIDLLRLGVTGALRVAEAAFGYEIPVVLGAAPGNLAVHVASVLPNFMGMEVTDTRGGLSGFASVADFHEGRASAGDRPGLGLEAGADP